MKLLSGDDYGIARDEKHLVVETENPRVVFSFTRYGNAISAHFATDNKGLRGVRYKIEEFCKWAFDSMPWCEAILGNVGKDGVERLVKRCGFRYAGPTENGRLYVRYRQWEA